MFETTVTCFSLTHQWNANERGAVEASMHVALNSGKNDDFGEDYVTLYANANGQSNRFVAGKKYKLTLTEIEE